MNLGYVVLYVNDTENSKDFWLWKCGFKLISTKEFDGFKIYQVASDEKSTRIELIPLKLMENSDMNTSCPSILFEVENILFEHQNFHNLGIKTLDIEDSPIGKVFTFFDNENNAFAVTENKSASEIDTSNLNNEVYTMNEVTNINSQTFYHGTKANLKVGDLIVTGHMTNYGTGKEGKNVYFSSLLPIWGAELATGDGNGRIYIVKPTGDFINDPNLTNTKFKGNPTKSYCSKYPLEVVGEVIGWQGHTPESIKEMKDKISSSKNQAIDN